MFSCLRTYAPKYYAARSHSAIAICVVALHHVPKISEPGASIIGISTPISEGIHIPCVLSMVYSYNDVYTHTISNVTGTKLQYNDIKSFSV